MKIFLLDNLDSFTYNLAQLLKVCGAQVQVQRASETSVAEIAQWKPTHVIFSPGPGHPREHSFMQQCLQEFSERLPILGVCLGMQAINLFYGGTLKRDAKPMHGKVSQVQHQREKLFSDLPNPLTVARYHSLLVDQLGNELEINAQTASLDVMALSHNTLPIFGVQFHPESYLSEHGEKIMRNFLVL